LGHSLGWLQRLGHAFFVACPRAQNQPVELRGSVNTSTFKHKLKTFLFLHAFLYVSGDIVMILAMIVILEAGGDGWCEKR